jgi:energy-coupling factor transport system ATP-binding protein
LSFVDVPCIEIDGLTVRFPERERPALQTVTGRIERGTTIAITGPSGCGKTSLLRALAGFIPDMIPADVAGEIRFDGRVREGMDPAMLVPAVALVQQDPDAQICTLRVRAEVAFGPENLCLPRDVIEQRVQASIDAMGIPHLIHRDTTTLSGGEKQRLAVASILAMNPSVILLDEPTAHLDPAGAKTLFDFLLRVKAERACTLVVVEHRLAPLASLEPSLWVLDGGRLVTRHATREHLSVHRFVAPERFPSNGTSDSARTALRMRHVSFGHGPIRLLEDLSFSVQPGTILGIIGPNGSGKTTLLRLLAGLERPDDGEITLPEDPGIGMVFQHPHHQIFERTVRRDLEIEGPIDEQGLSAALQSARLEGMADVPPHSLSLGEQRRLTVLAAFRKDPRILLLDEPFIGQDRENVLWIVDRILAARAHGAAVCLVTHDIPMAAALCDRMLFLGDRVLEGAPDEVFDELRSSHDHAFTPEFWEMDS